MCTLLKGGENLVMEIFFVFYCIDELCSAFFSKIEELDFDSTATEVFIISNKIEIRKLDVCLLFFFELHICLEWNINHQKMLPYA